MVAPIDMNLELDPKAESDWAGFHPLGKIDDDGSVDEPRLTAATRALAKRYLSGEIGRNLQKISIDLASELYLEVPSKNRLYAAAVRLIAENAPLRVLSEELLAGAATLEEASFHRVPILGCSSVSHTTIGFEHSLSVGYNGLKAEIEARLDLGGLDAEGVDLLNAMLACIESASIWKQRYVRKLEALGCADVLESIRNVPENPPSNFREAIQSLWLLWDFQRLCGNWSGIGRFDKMLGSFLKKDLKGKRITLDEARELIAHFWIKGCEWTTATGCGSGDAQHYQNIVLAGVDEAGDEVANEVTDLVLDVVEELHISDFPIAVRISSKTDDRLMRRIAAIQRLGGGIIAIYNEDRIIPSLVKFGYPLEEARNFANDGCWEVLIPGKSFFCYRPFDLLYLLQETLHLNSDDAAPPCFESFEALYNDFKNRLAGFLTRLFNEQPIGSAFPTVLIDLLVEGCIEKGRAYYNLGPKYTACSPHAGGLPDVANSLLAIKSLVYEEHKFTLAELVAILRADWKDHEATRLRVRDKMEFYGNDSAGADTMLQQVFNDYTDLVAKAPNRSGLRFPAGISTFGREGDTYLSSRKATAAGSKKGDILALNFSPSPGTDRKGPTAVIKSHCSVDFSKLPCGTALELKIVPASLEGEGGLSVLAGLMKTFVRLGGIFLQIDVVDTAMLLDAQAHPEKYPNLAVRISGWSARFATLSPKWQDMVITRSEQRA